MIVLGIESTAHTFGVGIVENEKIIADARAVFRTEPGKGYVPRELAEHHAKNAKQVLQNALNQAKLNMKEVDVIAFSQGMGIPNSLRVGASLARYLSLKYNKPLVGVNHGIAHIEIGKLTTKARDPVCVYLSGGNTQIIAYSKGKYRIFGETQDITLGNLLDVVAREMGYDMPGGPKIEKLAKKGKFVEMPYVVKGMDLSYSGLLTHAIRLLKKGVSKEDIAYSLQEVAFAMIVEVAERAMAQLNKKEVLLIGGVAANKRLQQMFKIMCKERNAKSYVVDTKYASDNGVMIAYTGLLAYKSGQRLKIEESGIKPKWRVDEVEITWLD